MASLVNTSNNKTVKLRSQHVFGRHPATANTVLRDDLTSRVHALIYWSSGFWKIKDSSTNGTFINRQQMTSGNSQILSLNDEIQFGTTSNRVWKVVNLDRPQSMLVCVGEPDRTIELSGLTVLPTVEQPELSIYQNKHGQWLMESDVDQLILQPGTRVTVGGRRWYFIAPDDIDETQPAPAVGHESPGMQFKVSTDEEHVELTIKLEQQCIELEERVHHYLLLCLARQKLSDSAQGVESLEQGWLDKDLLVKMTGMEEKHINIQIYRFRKQLLENDSAISQQLMSIVQRRRGQLRLDCDQIEIIGGNMRL